MLFRSVALVGCIKDKESAQSSPWLYVALIQIVMQHFFVVNYIGAFKAASEWLRSLSIRFRHKFFLRIDLI